jgi:hypothetical protein
LAKNRILFIVRVRFIEPVKIYILVVNYFEKSGFHYSCGGRRYEDEIDLAQGFAPDMRSADARLCVEGCPEGWLWEELFGIRT